MADNVTLNTGTGGDVIAAKDDGTRKHQQVLLEFEVGTTPTLVDSTHPLPTQNFRGTVATRSTSVTTTDAAILASNTSRVRATFYNDADQDFLLGEGTAAATSTDFSIRIKPGGFYSADDYTGAVHGLFVAALGSGKLMITEIT